MEQNEAETARVQPVEIKIETGSSQAHVWQVLGTLLVCGAVGMICWALADAGWLEVASTMMTMLVIQFVRLLYNAGIVRVPEREVDGEAPEFEVTKSTFRKITAEFKAWQARSNMLRLFLLALVISIGFMLARMAMSAALTIFSNMWIAGAAAACLAALIVAPNLLGNFGRSLKSKGVVKR